MEFCIDQFTETGRHVATWGPFETVAAAADYFRAAGFEYNCDPWGLEGYLITDELGDDVTPQVLKYEEYSCWL
jgi:hypothetical protein